MNNNICFGCNKHCLISAALVIKQDSINTNYTPQALYMPAINERIVTGYVDEKGIKHDIQPCSTASETINLIKQSIIQHCCYNSRNVK